MDLYEKLVNKEEKLSITGLGYVGLPLAVAFARKAAVVGFDLNSDKIKRYKDGSDPTREVGDEAIKETKVEFTSDEGRLREAKFHIIAVPTPINADKTPDLSPVTGASKIVGRNLVRGSVIVYESTVYPGVTEDICVPILEKESGLVCGVDFKVGYSPERINPGDKIHRLETIVKIVSGMDNESLELIAKVYEMIIEAGVYRAESIKVAEAAKVVENSQRDINIAFMNELAMVFNKMEIDTKQVIEAMNTKWNALRFYPGLVGGHCIGVDPYYFIYRAEQLGYRSQIISSGRRINDDMANYVGENIIRQLIMADKKVKGAKVAILGITFKENCPDTRNSRVFDIMRYLEEYEIELILVDPVADNEASEEHGIELKELGSVKEIDALVVAVAHDEFRKLTLEKIVEVQKGNPILIDVKGIYDKSRAEDMSITYWRM